MTTKTPKFKVGTRVSFYRKNGAYAEGRVDGTDMREDGKNVWVAVNTAPPRQNRIITKLRPTQLTRL